jgi:hypothetical protein
MEKLPSTFSRSCHTTSSDDWKLMAIAFSVRATVTSACDACGLCQHGAIIPSMVPSVMFATGTLPADELELSITHPLELTKHWS